MMSGFLDAVTQRTFWSEVQIRELVRYDSEKKGQQLYGRRSGVPPVIPLTSLRAMLIFTVEKEQTWLVADHTMVYCVLDDRRRERPQILARVKLAEALPVHVDETGSERIGALQFGNKAKKWLYSKELFLNERPEQAISGFLSWAHG
jgi:hypothetical protein